MKVFLFLVTYSCSQLISAFKSQDLYWKDPSAPDHLDSFSGSHGETTDDLDVSVPMSSHEPDTGSQQPSDTKWSDRRSDSSDDDLEMSASSSGQMKEDPLQSILPRVKFVCKGRPEGYYADTDFDCEVFHYCKTSGFRFTFVCPPKSKFNQKQMTCDYEAKESLCSEALKYQKQLSSKSKMAPLAESLTSTTNSEQTSESVQSVQSSPLPNILSGKESSATVTETKSSSVSSQPALPPKDTDHYVSKHQTKVESSTPNYYQFSGNVNKYVSPSMHQSLVPKTTTPLPSSSPSPVYRKESTSNNNNQQQSSYNSATQDSNSYLVKVNDDDSFKPISLKGEKKVVPNPITNTIQVSNDHQEESSSPSPPSASSTTPAVKSTPSPAFSIIWNHDQNAFSSFRPSQPYQMKPVVKQFGDTYKLSQGGNKVKITENAGIDSSFVQISPAQFQSMMSGSNSENQQPIYKHFSSLESNKVTQPPYSIESYQDGVIMSNYELQPMFERPTTTISPILATTKIPQIQFQKLLNQFSHQTNYKSTSLPPTLKVLRMQPPRRPQSIMSQPLHHPSFSNSHLSSLLMNNPQLSTDDMDEISKFPQVDHMFGLPKVSPSKEQPTYEFDPPHNFHTQVPQMMPFSNNQMPTMMPMNHNYGHGINPEHVNSGSFMADLNNLFSKHFNRARPSNLRIPTATRSPPAISFPKFPPNSLTSWFNKPKDLSNINLMTSGSHNSYPSFADPPPQAISPVAAMHQLPPPPQPNYHSHHHYQMNPAHKKKTIFTTITRFFSSPSSPPNEMNRLRAPIIDQKISESHPPNFLMHGPFPPQLQRQVQFSAPSPVQFQRQNFTKPEARLAVSTDLQEVTEVDEEEGGDEKPETATNIQNIESNASSEPSAKNSTSQHDEPMGRSPRRKRQIFRHKDLDMAAAFNMFPIYTTSNFNENLLLGTSQYVPNMYETLTFLPGTPIVSQGSSIRTTKTRRPPGNVRYAESADVFSNPFPTVPLPTFGMESSKPSKAKQAYLKAESMQLIPASFSAGPLKFNPQTGTFYEPIFGSEIPVHLTFGDFQKMPENLINGIKNEKVKTSSSDQTERRPAQQNLSQNNAKVLSYEYMYQPIPSSFSQAKGHKKQPFSPNYKDKHVSSLAQVSYEKINMPPLKLREENPKPKYHSIPIQKYRFPDESTSRRPTPPKHGLSLELFKKPVSETRPRYNHGNNNNFVEHQNHYNPPKHHMDNFAPSSPPKSSYHQNNYPAGSSIEYQPKYHRKPQESFRDSSALDNAGYRVNEANQAVDERPSSNYQSIPKQFIPYESPEIVTRFKSHVNNDRNNRVTSLSNNDINQKGIEYQVIPDEKQHEGLDTKANFPISPIGSDSNHNDDRHSNFYEPNVYEVTTSPPTIVPTTTVTYRPYYSLPPIRPVHVSTPSPPRDDYYSGNNKQATPVYGQKLNTNQIKPKQHQTSSRDQIVVEKQWFPEAPYTRVYTTPSTTTSTTGSPMTVQHNSYSDWPVFKKHQNYLPPTENVPKTALLDEYEEETEEVSENNTAEDQNYSKDENSNTRGTKYTDTYPVPVYHSSLVTTPPPPLRTSTLPYIDSILTTERSVIEKYYPASEDYYHETNSNVHEQSESTSTSFPERNENLEDKKDGKLNLFGNKKKDYSKYANRFKSSVTRGTTTKTTTTTTAATRTTTATTASPPKNHENHNYYGSRVGVTKAPKTKVSVHASVSSDVSRKPSQPKVNQNHQNHQNYDFEDFRNSLESESVTRRPVVTGYTYRGTSSTTKKPDRTKAATTSYDRSRDWMRYRQSTTSSTTQAVPSSTVTQATTTSTFKPSTTSTPSLFTGKVENFATLFDNFDTDEGAEGDYDVVEEEGQESQDDMRSSSTTTTTSTSTSPSTSSTAKSDADSLSYLKVYSSSSAGALNTRLSGLRMKNLFGQKKRPDQSSSSRSVT